MARLATNKTHGLQLIFDSPAAQDEEREIRVEGEITIRDGVNLMERLAVDVFRT
jgi:hypothetical protein